MVLLLKWTYYLWEPCHYPRKLVRLGFTATIICYSTYLESAHAQLSHDMEAEIFAAGGDAAIALDAYDQNLGRGKSWRDEIKWCR